MSKWFAYCFQNGELCFAERLPKGALIVEAQPLGVDFKTWRDGLKATCRLSYSGTFLIPGMPEAQNEDEKLEALTRFTNWLMGLRANRAKLAAKNLAAISAGSCAAPKKRVRK